MQSARDAGTGLFFSGSNEIYWRIRFEAGPTSGVASRTEVCYKSVQGGATDPSGTPTSTWRDPAGPNSPENALTGEQYIGDNDTTYFPLVVNAIQGADRIYRYTGLDQLAPGASKTIGSTDRVGVGRARVERRRARRRQDALRVARHRRAPPGKRRLICPQPIGDRGHGEVQGAERRPGGDDGNEPLEPGSRQQRRMNG